MKTHLSVLFIALSVTFQVSGQAILNDLKKLNQHYLEMDKYAMDFEIQYFGMDGNLLTGQKGSVAHSAEIHYTDMGGNISLLRNGEFIFVNSQAGHIVYNLRADTEQNKEVQSLNQTTISDMTALLDSLWSNQKGMSYTYQPATKKGHKRVFISDKNNPYFDAYTIEIDARSYAIKEFTYHTKTDKESQVSKVSIFYRSETSQPKLNDQKLTAAYYLRARDGEMIPSKLFAGYEVINQTLNHF